MKISRRRIETVGRVTSRLLGQQQAWYIYTIAKRLKRSEQGVTKEIRKK